MLLFAHDCECVEDHGADMQNSCVSAFLNRVKSADRQAFCLSAKMMGVGVGVGGQHRQSAIAHV